jgi:flagellar biosynthesis protein FlhG
MADVRLLPKVHPHIATDSNTVWAIGGGKGGIGKSFISSNLAICLSRFGRETTLVDLDLGSANLHTCLGIRIPNRSLSDYVSGRVSSLNEISVDTGIPGLKFISGSNDALNAADINFDQRMNIMRGIREIKTPYVILDLGAGTSESMLDFFLAADQRIVATTPEPTSIENAYRFIKSSYYRKLRNSETELGLKELISKAMDERGENGIRSPADLITHINRLDPVAGRKLIEEIAGYQVHLLMNQVRTHQDVDLGHSMRSVCRKYFGIEANYLGNIHHDNAVWQALRKRRPLMLEYPYSEIVGQFLNITRNLLNTPPLRAVV